MADISKTPTKKLLLTIQVRVKTYAIDFVANAPFKLQL